MGIAALRRLLKRLEWFSALARSKIQTSIERKRALFPVCMGRQYAKPNP